MKRSVPLFYPSVPLSARELVGKILRTRWIGQGPQVDLFEKKFKKRFHTDSPVAVGSGTDALHLAYLLSNIKDGDEVIAPVFTCTATNLPLLYQRANIKFADINLNSLNISVEHVSKLLTKKTKAIVVVDYGGLPCDLAELKFMADQYGIPLIEDAAHSLGAKYLGKDVGSIADFTIFSFQAIKLLTTGDGGMLTVKDDELMHKAKRLRWFGIDRQAKSLNNWDNEITEVGYKYQMNDISAAMGVATLPYVAQYLATRKKLFILYKEFLKDISGIKILNDDEPGKDHAHWLMTILVERRSDFEKAMANKGIGCTQTHYRNDRYKIFGDRRSNLPNMDALEDSYTILPLHNQMTPGDVKYICDAIKEGW